jgi:ABC-type multidrug transport system ATPase subunit
VGPNNSGKSLALREIEEWCSGKNPVFKVVKEMAIDFPDSDEDALALLKKFETTPPPNRFPQSDTLWVGQHIFSSGQPARLFELNIANFRHWVASKQMNIMRQYLSIFFTVRLDGRTRFSLVDEKPSGDLQGLPQNHLWALFKDAKAREKVRELTEDAFDLHFVVDPTGMTVFRIRLSQRAPTSSVEEQSLNETARKFHANAPLIQQYSDGVQAFVGLISAILSIEHKIILLDEPEAFLHPPLARRLGTNMSKIAAERDASLLVATHSAEFVMGCLQSEKKVSVVRLTYENVTATARVMESAELSLMMQDPLLRSTGELRALFHRAVVVTESDTDRAFYDEMNRRLERVDRGVRDSIFLNAQNKQTIQRLVAPLRRVGIPAAAIIDLDMIKEAGTNWTELLDACQVDKSIYAQLENERSYLSDQFTKLTKPGAQEPIKSLGLNALGSKDKARAETFLNDLSKYGIFLVSVGELESWLSVLGIGGHAAEWLVKVFSSIGTEESDPAFLYPASGDVWDFLDKIAGWVNDNHRLGIP